MSNTPTDAAATWEKVCRDLKREAEDWKEALANDRQALTGALHDLGKARQRVADLETERAHIIRQYDENLDCGLRISTKLEEAEKRIKELEAQDANSTKIIDGYRKLHVEQHQKIHKLVTAMKCVRDTAVALVDVNRQGLNSCLTIEAPQRIRDIANATLAALTQGEKS